MWPSMPPVTSFYRWPNVVITPMEAESRRPYLLCVIWPLTRAIRTISTRRSRTRRKMLMVPCSAGLCLEFTSCWWPVLRPP
ncbi:Ferric-chelate reductase 1 [Daphnia magna]|uniref:Ferric-chelate reductase 1 n=1 Tax=Daphnia magna TaxID=35525 RepID=A0A162C612_9CRUS|nr:Ferric-chelate reductase 1 [Daphnia magna]